ncbi:patatin-like phospholipase family protein [Acuticoccus sp. I52.16.1]|uniref:patatin-like phospholipase family protein n=1 Tax=Acuticoccus sp. I52.16.1 TaxID=2928472 RepID=UPI001FD51042|nr:patatin-like phospholipase family protein [Acuticoccus sp. I52.16.1]UOM36707.1 patatin-like phospholipase family protein [Acuticoccus sp. I52.16.1]
MNDAKMSSAAVRRNILALDGGGVRGAISIAFLERIEALLAERGGGRLADHFDLIGGTSTGAIIAGALTLGYSATDIRDFYLKLAPQVFRRSWRRLPGLQSVFDPAPLTREIAAVVGDRTLESPDLRTHLAIVMKRIDTGSAWVVTNNPRAPYWDDPADGSYVGNRRYMLKALIRASTAAPHYFAPEPIPILSNQPPGLFVDGGVTPYNNPSLLLAMVATIPAYGFGWPWGADRLTIFSVGTGAYRATLDPAKAARMSSAGLAVKALAGLITDAEVATLTLLQWLGRAETVWPINSEIGDLTDAPRPDPLFSFTRYDVRLEAPWLEDELGMRLTHREIEGLRQIDNASMIPLAYEIAGRAAEKFVEPRHLEPLLSVASRG